MLYLEALMAPLMAEQLNLRLLEPPQDWLPQLPQDYRKRWINLQTFGQAKALSEAAFVKPPNDKSFPARIYRGSELPEGYDDNTPYCLTMN
ncbi:MAG: hypothetical protein AAFX95_04365 [Cyanobacteria bacterium J06639_16]